MNTANLIYDLPHIVALKTKLDRAQAALDLPARHARREPLCPHASDSYNEAAREYFAAIDEARESLRSIEVSIGAAYNVRGADL
jgi:hypothetical protein